MRQFSIPKRWNVIKVTPEQFGYEDRGIVKWFGMMLSDHSEALKKEEVDRQMLTVAPKNKMTEIEISKALFHANADDYPILIQANIIKNGNYYKDIECKVLGYDDNQIYLLLRDGRTVSCTLDQIRNVECMDSFEWYDKMH
ncbi:hypothetical protein AB4Y30_08210 [Ornithinibacillus sp. 4-3]|uniref:YolD-like family protein n=1 Tax=Ornithinibacillus sp. 4-3 TaxID=3231488 RepID=A0AB39HQT4_9BACI